MALYYLELLCIQAKDLCRTCVGVPKKVYSFLVRFGVQESIDPGKEARFSVGCETAEFTAGG